MPDGLVIRYEHSQGERWSATGRGCLSGLQFLDGEQSEGHWPREEARKFFERLLALTNDLGLLSEEYDPEEKRLVGNFPQAFSHIASGERRIRS